MTSSNVITGRNKQRIVSFFETKASFAINIQPLGDYKAKYVVFKPYIRIACKDEELLELIDESFQFENTRLSENNRQKKTHQRLPTLNIQNFSDIEKIVNFLNDNSKLILSYDRFSVFKNFHEALKIILENGHIHKDYKDYFEQIIELKLQINSHRSNVDKNRYSKQEWVRIIKKHFEKGVQK